MDNREIWRNVGEIVSSYEILECDREESFHADFQPWLQQKLGIKSVASWAKMIMLTCHTEQEGFNQFFKLLNEFRQQNIDFITEMPTQANELAFQQR